MANVTIMLNDRIISQSITKIEFREFQFLTCDMVLTN